MNPAGQAPGAPNRMRPVGNPQGGGQGGGGGGAGIGRNEQPGLGHQLSRRVSSGALTGAQAQKTMQERQTLQKAYGSDWRSKVFGGAGKIQQARAQLKQNPNDPKLLALNQRLMGQRKQMLEAAKSKLGGGQGGGGGAGPRRRAGRVNPRGRGLLNPAGQG